MQKKIKFVILNTVVFNIKKSYTEVYIKIIIRNKLNKKKNKCLASNSYSDGGELKQKLNHHKNYYFYIKTRFIFVVIFF